MPLAPYYCMEISIPSSLALLALSKFDQRRAFDAMSIMQHLHPVRHFIADLSTTEASQSILGGLFDATLYGLALLLL